ncbi:hypothetical protein YPPY10_4651, partial [Yersinia pestis PY-10]
MSSAN